MMKRKSCNRKLVRILVPVFLLLSGTALLSSCYYDNEEYLYPVNGQTANCDTLIITYHTHIAPIFANNCNGCHTVNSPSGNIVTDNYSSLSANINKVWLSINHLPGAKPMPLGGGKLSACDLAKIRRWRNLNMPNN